jgi:peroxiredoxin
MRERRWFRWTFDIALFVVVLSLISLWQGRHLLGGSTEAPAFELTDMSGQTHRLSDYNGSPTLIVFWAPWCPICGAESDNLKRVAKWRSEKVDVISVVLGYESRESINDFMEKHDVNYPVLLGGQDIQKAYNISSFPTLYVIDEDGRIAHSKVGYTTTLGMWWRSFAWF